MKPLSLLLEWHFPLLPGLAPPESSLLLSGLAGHHLPHLPGCQVQSEAGHQVGLRGGGGQVGFIDKVGLKEVFI